ncbi:Transcriptional regulatory protein TdiR [Ferriphaselus amnicola]|uniref:Transcriptional regulatory protein TdiR n=1 Tax=Ferriphaselus amnicola TaxID=1188319 RepID=A0A2Z6G8F8_9PROT|nr:response regulator [Ferriphaselus amnicola]BBE49742.1 Transcriptional regulatory protein TdiR [Ferriphaselus amnicola]
MAHTIYIVDDDASVRRGLVTLLKISGYAVEAFDCGEALLDRNPTGQGVILLDMRMPGLSGLQVQRALIERCSDLPIIFLTAFADVPRVVSAMQNGAEEFFIKPVSGEQLVCRIEQVIQKHEIDLERQLARKLFDAKLSDLTDREVEVLKLSIAGLSCKDMGAQLGVSHRTIELHRSHIFAKLDTASLSDLLRTISRLGITLT